MVTFRPNEQKLTKMPEVQQFLSTVLSDNYNDSGPSDANNGGCRTWLIEQKLLVF